MMFDSDDSKQVVTNMTQVLWDMYSKIHDQVDAELMRLDEEELRIMKIVYSDQLNYPIHEHIDQLLEGASHGDTVH
jgi:hypothetical protein